MRLLYDYSEEIQAIIHVHNVALWQGYQNRLPTTAAGVPYGTPAMAYEMWRLMDEADLLHTAHSDYGWAPGRNPGVWPHPTLCSPGARTVLAPGNSAPIKPSDITGLMSKTFRQN